MKMLKYMIAILNVEIENISVNKYSIKIKWRIKIYQRKKSSGNVSN